MTIPTIVSEPAKEPAITVGVSTGTVAGIISLIQFVDPDLLSTRQTEVILVVAAFALPIITAILTRPKVWSPATVQQIVNDAVRQATEEAKKSHTTANKGVPIQRQITES